MKPIPTLVLTTLFLAATALARDEYTIKKVQPAIVQTPEISFTGTQHRSGRAENWLEVEVNFDSDVDFTDELTFKYYILIAGKCLTGEVTHVNIPKGRDLYSVMYISPRTLQRVLENHPMTAQTIENAGVQILNKGQLVAEKSFKDAGGEWWQRLQQISGLVLNKNETPFAPLYWDRYEAIKAAPKS